MSDPAIRIEIHIDPQIVKAFLAAVNVAAITAPIIERFAEKFTEITPLPPHPQHAMAPAPEPPVPIPPSVEPPPVPPSTSPTKLNGGKVVATAVPGPAAVAAFHPGDMVRLNNPEPPLRVHSGRPDAPHTELQRGEVGQITRILNDGNLAIRWNREPGFEVALKPEWLLPDNEVKFAEPYEQQTAAAYAAYVRRWLEVAVANHWTKEQVQERWGREATEIRTRLGEHFAGPDWDDLSAEMQATVKKLAAP